MHSQHAVDGSTTPTELIPTLSALIMATGSIVLPSYGLNQEHRCNEQKIPRYYKLTWQHLTIPIGDAKDTLIAALPYALCGVFSSIRIVSLYDALYCPYNGLYWDETQGIHLDRSLDVLVDAGETKNGATIPCGQPCGQPHLAIPLGGQIPRVESYRTSGLHVYTSEGVITRDRKTVFDRVYQEQVELQKIAEDKIGRPIVKCVQYVCVYRVFFFD